MSNETFVGPAAEAAIEIGRWCFDQVGRFDMALLGAFEYAMKQRQVFGGTAADLEAWFDSFSHEDADAESQVLAAETFTADRAAMVLARQPAILSPATVTSNEDVLA